MSPPVRDAPAPGGFWCWVLVQKRPSHWVHPARRGRLVVVAKHDRLENEGENAGKTMTRSAGARHRRQANARAEVKGAHARVPGDHTSFSRSPGPCKPSA